MRRDGSPISQYICNLKPYASRLWHVGNEDFGGAHGSYHGTSTKIFSRLGKTIQNKNSAFKNRSSDPMRSVMSAGTGFFKQSIESCEKWIPYLFIFRNRMLAKRVSWF
jgi:hypothetical protein